MPCKPHSLLDNGHLSELPLYYINLDTGASSHARDKSIQKEWSLFTSSNVYRTSAVRGTDRESVSALLANHHSKYTQEILEATKAGHKEPSPGEVGTTLSHLCSIRHAYETGEEVVIIIEDDTSLRLWPYWRQSIDSFIQGLPQGWQTVQLGYIVAALPHQQLQTFRIDSAPNTPTKIGAGGEDSAVEAASFKRGSSWGTQAYAIHRRGMEELLSLLCSPSKKVSRLR
jgi:GR25 family glycosyltransferase involved in LPS biosynthesis